ncbi:MAG: DUF6088 family protein [Balneolaceae bacterium]
MKITEYIGFIVDRMPKGYVFTYEDFYEEVKKKEAIIKALNRMADSGKIAKLSKGKYYKPEKTSFGELQPNQYQVVKDLMEEAGNVTGYLTGYSIYNELGLTTQVSNTIQIGKNAVRPKLKRGKYTIRFVRQKNTITKENIPLLQILDSIRYIKKIPDTTIEKSTNRLKNIVGNLSEEDKQSIVRLAKKSPPSTRALLGAILEELKHKKYTEKLRSSLNPITTYNLPGVSEVLSVAENWNIK